MPGLWGVSLSGGALVSDDFRQPLRLSGSLVSDISKGTPLFLALASQYPIKAVRGWRELPTIAFTPQIPGPWFLIWSICARLGIRILANPADADIVIFYQDSTVASFDARRSVRPGQPTINRSCRNIGKSYVARQFESVFGYPLAIDPRTFNGPIVAKSNDNAAHDGRVLNGPLAATEPGVAYQRLIDNRAAGGLVVDLRVLIYGARIPVVMRKYRPVGARFSNDNCKIEVSRPEAEFSPAEIACLLTLARSMRLDMGAFDVLRDNRTGQIFVVDVNKTDMGPPLILPLKQKLAAIDRLGAAFVHLLREAG